MKQSTTWLTVANSFGTFGYISVLFQWAWTSLILLYPVLIARPDFLFPKDQPIPTSVESHVTSLTPAMAAIAIAITIAVLGITIIVLLRLPKTIGKQAAKLTYSTALSVVPAITHHKKISKKKRAELSYKVILIIKLLLVIVPIVALLFAQPIKQIGPDVIGVIALFCAACSISHFILQQFIARLANIDIKMIW